MAKNIKLVIGSTRNNRIAPQIAAWAEKHAAQNEINLEVIDLKELDLPLFDAPVPPAYAPPTSEKAKEWAGIVSETDGFIFLTPEYNRSIPASLKNALDHLSPEWKDKPAAIVSYGYIDGGKSATKHLEDILAWHKMPVVQPTVALQLSQDLFEENGAFKDIDSAFEQNVSVLSTAVQQFA